MTDKSDRGTLQSPSNPGARVPEDQDLDPVARYRMDMENQFGLSALARTGAFVVIAMVILGLLVALGVI